LLVEKGEAAKKRRGSKTDPAAREKNSWHSQRKKSPHGFFLWVFCNVTDSGKDLKNDGWAIMLEICVLFRSNSYKAA
jgi:hypothetical protein